MWRSRLIRQGPGGLGLLCAVLLCPLLFAPAMGGRAMAEEALPYSSRAIQQMIDQLRPPQLDAPEENEIRRDPFAATRKLLNQKVKPTTKGGGNDLGFQADAASGLLPRMRLRGHIQGEDGQVVALLEIENGTVYIVREGDTVGLHEFGHDAVIRVEKIDRLHMVIESGSLGQLIIVR